MQKGYNKFIMWSAKLKNTTLTIFAAAVIYSLLSIPRPAHSLFGLPSSKSLTGGPFAGKILYTINCSCSSFSLPFISKIPFIGKIADKGKMTLIQVSGSQGGTFIRLPGVTSVYNDNNISIGHTVIGQASPGLVPCAVGKIPACLIIGSGSPILKIGTN